MDIKSFDIQDDSFFKKVVAELLKENVYDNNYRLERVGKKIIFTGNDKSFRESTAVISDEQLRKYWEELSIIFDDYHEFSLYSAKPKLCAFINNKLVEVISDNICDSWIYEVKVSKKLVKTNQKH